MSPPSKHRFNLEAGILEDPRTRRHVGALLRGWSSSQSQGTKEGRYLDLQQFSAFVLDEDLPPPGERDDTRAATVMLGLLRAESSHAAVSGFIEWMPTRRRYSAETMIRKVKTLRLWARYLYDKGASPRNLDSFSIPKASALENARAPTTSPDEDAAIEHLNIEAQEHAHQILEARDQTIVDLLVHSSLDHTQLLDLDWRDVDFGKHPVLDADDRLALPVRIKVSRKDGREYWRALAPHATNMMRQWHHAYVNHFCGAMPHQPVFTTIAGRRLSSSRLYEIAEGSRAEVKVAALKPQHEPAAAST